MESKVSRRLKIAENTRALLAAAFPKTFMPKGKQKVPLKIGIREDIAALGSSVSMRRLKIALRDYTSGPLYLRALTEGAPRYDLDGNIAGTVTAHEADFARKQLKALNRKKHHRRRSGKPSAKRRLEQRVKETNV